MRRLIIIAGASGAGKSFLLQQTSKIAPHIEPIKKKSTRPPRPYEDPDTSVDLIFDCTEVEIRRTCQYTYTYEGYSYGIEDSVIQDTLRAGKTPFVIVRDCNEIVELKESYPNCLVLYLQSGFSGEDLKSILRSQGRKDLDIEIRDSRIRKDAEQYRIFYYLFDYVLINYYEEETLVSMFKSILKREKKLNLVKSNRIFVLMSFNEELLWVFKEMKRTVKDYDSNITIERIDDRKGTSFKITDAILTKIKEAELIICDLTEEKPNVYYELGFSEGVKKKFILTAHKDTNIHFDISGYKVIFYDNGPDLNEKLLGAIDSHFSGRS